jgi:hypothetical protein
MTSDSWTTLPSGVDNLKSGGFSPILGAATAAIEMLAASAATTASLFI